MAERSQAPEPKRTRTDGGTQPVVLYSYWRSSTSFRARIVLAWKGIAYEYRPVHLVKGEQRSEEYRKTNPMGAVPTLVIDGETLTQSQGGWARRLLRPQPYPHLRSHDRP
jgi:glutaredoxin